MEHTFILNFCFSFKAEFRFYWLQSKFFDEPQMGVKSPGNRYPLVRVPFVSCTIPNMEALMVESELPTWTPLDGLLFYHKFGMYTPNVSPLVGWLKPFMLPEVLNVSVSDFYLQKKPVNYVSIRHHLKMESSKEAHEPEELMIVQDGITC